MTSTSLRVDRPVALVARGITKRFGRKAVLKMVLFGRAADLTREAALREGRRNLEWFGFPRESARSHTRISERRGN